MVNRRWCFLLTGTGDEVLENTTVEIRAETVEDAIARTSSWTLLRQGATFTPLGERVGHASSQRFIASVPVAELPEYIRQNERVVAGADEVAA
jgi:hypothetical protein